MADTKAVAKATPAQSVTYKLSNGESVSLNEAAVRKLTNNNQYITQGEINLFIETCKYQKLNPFVGEAYLVKYDGSKPASRVVSLSAFARIADEQKDFDGIEDGIIVKDAKGNYIDREGCIKYPDELLVGGWANVYRTTRSKPFKARVLFSEYNKGQAMWKVMPAVMINKVAKVTAYRKAYPAAMNGCYIAEELGMSETQMNEAPKAAAPTISDEAFDVQFDEKVDFEGIKRDSEYAKQDFDTPFTERVENFGEEEEPDFGIELETLQTGEKKRIPYTEYTANKSKYEKVPDSYDRTSKTIEVYEKG